MSSATKDFISCFHSLDGMTIGERRKNLFSLLNQTREVSQSSSCNEIDFSALHPKTPLEEVFKVEALIYFRKIPDLVEILKSENPILIKKVLKNSSWFLEQAFHNFSGEQFVSLILPNVSFNVKVKIVNGLALYLTNSQQADSFFEAIHQKYGLYLALKLLPCCSKDFIKKVVEKHGRKLSSKQLEIVLQRYPEIAEEVFDALDSTMDEFSIRELHNKHFIYLARTYNPVFLKLYYKYSPSVQLGWRASRKFISSNKQTVIDDARNLYKLLHKKQSFKSLRHSFNEYYRKLFPIEVKNFPNSFPYLFSLVKPLPDIEKIKLFEENFQNLYGSNLWENPRCLMVALLDILPLEKRVSIQCKPYYVSDDRWTCYLGTDESIPLLKKRISLSSDISTRGELITNLVETCRINKDKEALLNVCQYVVAQHRNDHVSVRNHFLTALKRSFELENLEEQHWVYINELLQIFEINTEIFKLSSDFLLAYIHHRLLKELPIRQYFSDYLRKGFTNFNLFKYNPKFEKHCLELVVELLPHLYDGITLKYRYIDFLSAVINWNQRHLEDQISIFHYAEAFDAFKYRLMEKSYNMYHVIVYCLRLKPTEALSDDMEHLCLSNLTFQNASVNINWLLRRKMSSVVKNLELIITLALESSDCFFWRYCKNYTHLMLPEKIIAASLKIIHSMSSNEKRRQNAVIALSHLMATDKFLEFVADYYPVELKVDTLNEESRNKYKTQIVVANCLNNIIPPSAALVSILNFCKGDYLKLTYSSLYSMCGNVNEYKLPAFYADLARRAVSIRKHAFHLTLRTLDRKLVFEMFNKFMETEKNSSIRKFLLQGSFNLFLQDPDDYTWELVKINLQAIDVDDREAIDLIITRAYEIPSDYEIGYIIFVWNFLEKLPEESKNKTAGQKFQLLRSLSPTVIQAFPKEFCYAIINTYFLKFTDSVELRQVAFILHSFVCKFVIYCSNQTDLEERLNMILPMLKDCMYDADRKGIPDSFLKVFYLEFLKRKCVSKQALFTFSTLWNTYIKPYEAFDHHLYLKLCTVFVDFANRELSLYQVGQKFAEMCHSLSNIYGAAIVTVLCDVMRSIIKYFEFDSEQMSDNNCYTIIEAMVKTNSSSVCLMTAISLLKTHLGDNTNVKDKHGEIVKILSDNPDPLIQVYLNHHLHKVNF